MTLRVRCFALLLALLAAAPSFRLRLKTIEFPGPAHDWPQFNFNAQHTGSNTDEEGITPQNVAELQLLFQAKLPAVSDGPPVYWTADSTHRDDHMLFFTTTNGALIAMRIAFRNVTGACSARLTRNASLLTLLNIPS